MNHAKWIAHFTRNRENRPEPDWTAPVNVPPAALAPSKGCPKPGLRGVLVRIQFLLFGYAAGTMLWINHAPCLKAIGGSRAEFYREVTRQLLRFIRLLRRGARPSPVPALWANSPSVQLQPVK